MKDERLHHLLDAFLDGALSPEEKAEFERLLLESDAARRQFWKRASLHGWTYSATKLAYSAKTAKERRQLRHPEAEFGLWSFLQSLFHWRRFAALATAGAAVAVTLLLLFHRPPETDPDVDDFAIDDAPEETHTNAVAVLARGAGVVWAPGTNGGLEIGALLDPGVLRLKSGVVQIETYSGARMILEGPAELELISAQEARLSYGKVSARVSEQAHGFKIYASDVTVTDLGTEFGVSRAPGEPAQVSVFEGKVELALPDNTNRPAQLVTQGESFEVQQQEFHAVSNHVAFTSPDELAKKERAELRTRYGAWRQNNNSLDSDPAMIAHFNFEKDRKADRRLADRATSKHAVKPATIVGCDWAEGRWPGKGALEFKRQSDRVQLAVPGHYQTLTYVTWVRIDSLPNLFNGLAMVDRHKPGEVHFQVRKNGQLIFAVRNPAPGPNEKLGSWDQLASKPLLNRDWLGRWIQIAAVYDGPAKTMSVYMNGDLVASKKIDHPQDLVVDAVELGNWSHRQSTPSVTRNLSGRMDEFSIFSRALSAQEISRQYELGKPRETITLASASRSPTSATKP